VHCMHCTATRGGWGGCNDATRPATIRPGDRRPGCPSPTVANVLFSCSNTDRPVNFSYLFYRFFVLPVPSCAPACGEVVDEHFPLPPGGLAALPGASCLWWCGQGGRASE